MTTEAMQIREVSAKYQLAGYEVRAGGSNDVIQTYCGPYIPDLIATRGEEQVIIETAPDGHSGAELQQAAEAISERGWRLDVVTGGESEVPSPISLAQIEEELRVFEKASTKIRNTRFLLVSLWALFEATIRRAALEAGLDMANRGPKDALKQSVSLGFVDEQDLGFLHLALHERDLAAHGMNLTSSSDGLTQHLYAITKRLVERLKAGYLQEA